jgi:hypothetical protein
VGPLPAPFIFARLFLLKLSPGSNRLKRTEVDLVQEHTVSFQLFSCILQKSKLNFPFMLDRNEEQVIMSLLRRSSLRDYYPTQRARLLHRSLLESLPTCSSFTFDGIWKIRSFDPGLMKTHLRATNERLKVATVQA